MSGRSVAGGALLAVGLLVGSTSHAATLQVTFTDSAGVGFNDQTPATPVGGNSGTTVGEQRRKAFQYALDQWGKILQSAVPITVSASFAPLRCSGGAGVLGQAAPTAMVMDEPGLPPGVAFPIALANALAGRDLDPTGADIEAEFNGDLMGCFQRDWYYGFDGVKGEDTDLVEVVMHEVGHGLGFTSQVDMASGELFMGYPDPYTQHLFDTTMNKKWTAMTDSERALSMTHARHVVWDGANVTAIAAQVLAKGAPKVTVSPDVPGFTGLVGEANFGPKLSAGTVAGSLVFTATVTDCSAPGSYSGQIPVTASRTTSCSPLTIMRAILNGAGSAAIYIADADSSPPSPLLARLEDLPKLPVSIPSVQLSKADGALLRAATGTVTATFSAVASQSVGADESGRVFLYASNPIKPGSTISHWDQLLRPDPLMEPSEGLETIHDLTLERALMLDIGWPSSCGNGQPDSGEECDDGAANSNTVPNACRTTCKKAFCGDGVVDTGEECDPQAPIAQSCKADCTKSSTPDGGGADSGRVDGGADAGGADSGRVDGGADAGGADSGRADGGVDAGGKGGGGGGCCSVAAGAQDSAWPILVLLAVAMLRRRRLSATRS